MKLALPGLYAAACRHVAITIDRGIGSVTIDLDSGQCVILIMGEPKIEINETNSTMTDHEI
jgi:hypothetical protein